MHLLQEKPPEYDNELDLEANFSRFFDWGLSLKDPRRTIRKFGTEMQRNPLGFEATYLTSRDQGPTATHKAGQVRANEYGLECAEDIHCHPFEFWSGVIKLGREQRPLQNVRYYPDWSQRLAPGQKGLIGYETWVDDHSQNHTMAATIPLPEPPSRSFELTEGQFYTMNPLEDFHRVEAEPGTLTIFCKTPAEPTRRALMLRHEDLDPPPETY
jgi:hypothetical protein